MDYSPLGQLHNVPSIAFHLEKLPPNFLSDLTRNALLELNFLKYIDQNRQLYYNEDFVAYSIQRYEKYWLPLVAQVSANPEDDLNLAPPMDIYWVWHVHMLSPTKYIKDCHRIIGRVIGHALASADDLKARQELTMTKWQDLFPKVPFSVGLDDIKAHPVDNLSSHIEYDIQSAALRQGSFYYQVSLDHFRNPMFLSDSLTRYKMFLILKQKYPEQFLVPCYDNDLIWHTHQVSTLNYAKDTTSILGHVLPHDDSVNERSKGSKLNTSSEETSKLWLETFGVPFSRPGCMYRGDPPFTGLGPISQHLIDSIRKEVEMTLHIKSIKVTQVTELDGNQLPSRGSLRILLIRKSNQEIHKLDKLKCTFPQDEKSHNFPVDSKYIVLHNGNPSIVLKLKRTMPLGSDVVIGSSTEPINLFALLPKPIQEGLPSVDKMDFQLSHPLNHTKTLMAEIEFSISDFKHGERTSRFKKQDTLFTAMESFGKCMDYTNNLDLWGPVNVPKTLSAENQDTHETLTK